MCEALSTVQLALGFLAMTGGEAHMQLGTYLKDVLQMTDHMGPHVYKVNHQHTRSSVSQMVSSPDVLLFGVQKIS